MMKKKVWFLRMKPSSFTADVDGLDEESLISSCQNQIIISIKIWLTLTRIFNVNFTVEIWF